MRWPIVRTTLFTLVLAGGVALALGKKKAADADAPADEAGAVEASSGPAAEPAPALFPDGLPVPLQDTPEGLSSLSAQGCNACHFDAHDRWRSSAHAQAWRSQSFQDAIERAGGSTACLGCHLPLANQHARLAAGYIDGDLARPQLQPNELWDATLMSEGVTCAACHVRDGKILGTHASDAAPHPVVVAPELATSEFCATCHQLTWPEADKPFYDTFGEWQASAYPAAGVRCQDCHMPPTAGLATATRFAAAPTHDFAAEPGRGLSVLVDLDSPELSRGDPWAVRLRLQNTGAGHHIPTGSPFRAYRVKVRVLDKDGEELADPWTYDLARQVEDAPPWKTVSDNRLPAGEERALDTSFTISQRVKAQRANLELTVHEVVGEHERPARIRHSIPVHII